MSSGWLIPVLGFLASVVAAYLTARVSKRKDPEDRELLVSETAERVQRMLNNCLERLDKVVQELEAEKLEAAVAIAELRAAKVDLATSSARIAGHAVSIKLLEAEVIKLGGNPDKLNGRAK